MSFKDRMHLSPVMNPLRGNELLTCCEITSRCSVLNDVLQERPLQFLKPFHFSPYRTPTTGNYQLTMLSSCRGTLES